MPTILLVEDDHQLRRMLRDCLESAGYDVVESPDGAHALRRLPSVQPDLIITDIVMPEREGLSTIREIRENNRNARIIAMSGDGTIMSSDQYLHVAHQLGANKVFLKPLDLEALLDAVQELLASP